MSRLEERKPEHSPSLVSHAEKLRRRLRAIKRFRRQSVTARAMRVESLLNEIFSDLTSGLHAASHQTLAVMPSNANGGISQEEHQRLLALLDHSRREYNSLIDFIDGERANGKTIGQLVSGNARPSEEAIPTEPVIPRPLSQDISVLHNQIEFLEQELASAIQSTKKNSEAENSLREQIEILRTQLLESRHETIELRIQNSDLVERADHANSSLTWEQRKEQLIKQLEADSLVDPEIRAQSNQIAAIVESSQREIDERDRLIKEKDRELDELKMLLTRQSSVTNGVAIGAAAVAQLMDADELLQAEREKLRMLQHEWEEKLRIAEIEISVERARIARERLEFETTVLSNPSPSTADTGGEHCQRSEQEPLGKPRRWLRRLGLRED